MALCLLAAALMGSCGGGKTVLSEQEEAVIAELGKDAGEGFEFSFTSFEKIDSTTMGEEIQRRIDAFQDVLVQNYRLYNSYVQNRKPKNAARKEQSIKLDTRMLEMLNTYKRDMGDDLGKVAYYDYRFSGEGKSEGAVYRYQEAYAAITPDNRIIGISSSLKNLHRATGKVIPGYSEILGGESEEDDSEIDE